MYHFDSLGKVVVSLSFLDRTNIGNARLVGIEKDLKMKGLDYNVWF